jgi:hypothetical protein
MLPGCQRGKEISNRIGARKGGRRGGSGNSQNPERDAQRGNDVVSHGGSGSIIERFAHSLVGKLKPDPRGGCVR